MSNNIKKWSKVICNNPSIGKDPIEVIELLIDNICMFIPGDEAYFTHVALYKNGITYIKKKEDVCLFEEKQINDNEFQKQLDLLIHGYDKNAITHTHVKPICTECSGTGILDFGFYTRKCMKCSGD